MTAEPRHRHFDRSMSEWIKMVANELPDDAVGLWQIVPDGRHGFGLEGEHDWIAQPQYGSKPDEIIENVVREWLANGAKDEDPGGLWFALREDAWFPSGSRDA